MGKRRRMTIGGQREAKCSKKKLPSVFRSRRGLRFHRDTAGATAVLVAISLPILLAIAGLGVDAGWWYTIKRQNQSAADAAALAAAFEVADGLTDVTNNLTPAATGAATLNGWADNATPPAGLTPISVTPYADGLLDAAFGAGKYQASLVVLQQQQNSWLANFASLANVTVSNRAVAVVSNQSPGGPGCLLALGRNPPPNGTQNLAQTISEKGNATINAPNCTVVSDSSAADSFYLQGSVTIDAGTLVTAGEITTVGGAYTLNLNLPAQIGANAIPDPYANTLTHASFLADMATAPACDPPAYLKASVTPGCIIECKNGKKADPCLFQGGTTDLPPGTYWITDGDLQLGPGHGGTTLECTKCTPGGAGVTLIFTTKQATGGVVGTVLLYSLANLDLNAPSTGPFAGMVLIQDGNGVPVGDTIDSDPKTPANGNGQETLSGLVYFPASALSFQGTPTSNVGAGSCLVVVANQLQLQGNATMAVNGCNSLGLKNLPASIKTVTLVE